MEISEVEENEFEPRALIFSEFLTSQSANLSPTQYQLTRSRITDPDAPIGALVARDDQGNIVGLANYVFHYSTWLDKPGCYLNDLFVKEPVRRQGIARKLIFALAEKAETMGCERLYWTTRPALNADAVRLYDSIVKAERATYRLALPTKKA